MKLEVLVTREVFQEVLDFLSMHFVVSANQSDLPMDAETLARAPADKHGALTTLTGLPDVHGMERDAAAKHPMPLPFSSAVGTMTIPETNCTYITLTQR